MITVNTMHWRLMARAEDVLVRACRGRGCTPESRAEWAEVQTTQRLFDSYGFDRALSIVNGQDVQTNADVRAWNELGKRRAA